MSISMKMHRILILEDDLETLATLLKYLTRLERIIGKDGKDIAVTILSEYWQVEEHINSSTTEKFDVILLDRDCKAGGSFHALDLNKYKDSEIIGISSIPEYNDQLKKLGIIRIVWKNHQNLDDFAIKVIGLVEEIISD